VPDRLASQLRARGWDPTHIESFGQATAEAAVCEFPVVLLDLSSAVARALPRIRPAGPPDTNDAGSPLTLGLQALRELRRVSPLSQVVLLVDAGLDLAACCQAVRYGAASFAQWKDGDPVDAVIDRLVQAHGRYQAAVEEGRELHAGNVFDQTGLAGQSQAMARLLLQAKRAAMISDAPVLIYGESGTGKQLLAEAVHRMDPKRRNKPFLSVNCAAITGSLAESLLFGHRKGAFTGATEDRPGYFRAANGGTLLLDEISELERTLQPKLLRVLQEGQVLPVGDNTERQIDVRVIAACNRPLSVLVEKGDFRLDLYQRLNVLTLNVPPLRDRPEDIPPLVRFFLRRYASYYPQPITSVDEQVYELLSRSVGSGNVRELENVVRQILVFKKAGTRIELSDIPPGMIDRQAAVREDPRADDELTTIVGLLLAGGRRTLPEMLDTFEAMVLREALSGSSVSHTQLARRLGLSRRTFYNKLRKYDLPRRGSNGS
jgi:transcriptional regulator with PAS, ATPase and Fis domain